MLVFQALSDDHARLWRVNVSADCVQNFIPHFLRLIAIPSEIVSLSFTPSEYRLFGETEFNAAWHFACHAIDAPVEHVEQIVDVGDLRVVSSYAAKADTLSSPHLQAKQGE